MKNIFYLTFLFAMAILPLKAGFASSPHLEISETGTREIITIEVPETSPHKVFILEKPNRLVVDIPAVSDIAGISLPRGYEGKLISGVRGGQFNPHVSRVVFELKGSVSIEDVKVDSKQEQLIVAIGSLKKGSTPTRGPISAKTVSVKRGKPVIVIDPGHGGQDPGTIGRYKTREKDMVLQYARSLQQKLIKTGRYNVVMTREGDKFIILRNRVSIARKAKGDLFISLHADSAPEKTARGLSVYTLSDTASDKEAEALAERENRADILSGIDLSHEREDVADILISLAQRETNNMSATFADMLVLHMQKKRVPLLPNPHRFAGFAVLKAPDIPSVLIETGFLSNPSEEKELKTRSYQDKVTSGIVAGIDAFFAYKNELEYQ